MCPIVWFFSASPKCFTFLFKKFLQLFRRAFHPKAAEYTFFLSAHGIFSKVDQMLGHKTNLTKFKKIEIISSMFSNHNGMKLDINHKKKN